MQHKSSFKHGLKCSPQNISFKFAYDVETENSVFHFPNVDAVIGIWYFTEH